MGAGSGMAGSLGVAAESVYGTRQPPNRFYKLRSAAHNFLPNRVQGEGINSGSYGPNAAHFAETHQSANGTYAIDVHYKRMGVLLNSLMGGGGTPVQQAASAAYLQTHTLGDTLGKSFTGQVGAPQRDGTVRCHEIVGGKVISAEFSCEVGGWLGMNAQVDARKFDATQTLATVSHDAGVKAFHGGQMVFKAGAYSSEAAIKIRSMSATIERPYDTEDFVSSNGGLKDEPVPNGSVNISGSVTVDWTNASGKTIQDWFTALTHNSVIYEWVDPNPIAASYFPTFGFDIPNVTWDGDIQGVDGPGELQSTFNWTWRDNESGNLPKIRYMSTDTTL